MKIDTSRPHFSLILTCYNEEEHLRGSVRTIINTLNNFKESYELIFVDDKSRDRTAQILMELQREYPNIRVYFNKRNVGRGGAVMEGIMRAKADIVGFIDIDLEVSPEYIPSFVSAIDKNEADVVIAHRYYPFHFYPFNYPVRILFSRAYSYISKYLLRITFQDTEAGYKFFNKKKILKILPKIENKRWFWDTEIVVRSLMEGLIIKELPVLFLRRKDKTTTVRLFSDSADYFKDLLKFKKKLAKDYPSKPPGWLYSFPRIYSMAMRMLYSKDYKKRYLDIVQLVINNSSVVDVCCGDCALYSFLKNKNIDYLGIDISTEFVSFGNQRKIKVKLADVTKDEIPLSDYIILQGSLYQFNNPRALVKKLSKSAKKAVIISESIEKMEDDLFFIKPIFLRVLPLIVGTKNDNPLFRYNIKGLKELLAPYCPKYFYKKGDRDIIAYIPT